MPKHVYCGACERKILTFDHLKSIHWVNSSAQGSCFDKMTADISSVNLERFGEKDPFFKKWRSFTKWMGFSVVTWHFDWTSSGWLAQQNFMQPRHNATKPPCQRSKKMIPTLNLQITSPGSMTSFAKACLPIFSLNFTPSFIVEPAKEENFVIWTTVILGLDHSKGDSE